MGRKRKVVTQDDGTPVEVETVEDDAAEAEEIAAEVATVFEDPAPAPAPVYGHDGPVEVVWTELGESDGVMSEHGFHKAGDVVRTSHSATLIANGYAVEK